MSDNLVLELLRAIRGDIAEIRMEQREQHVLDRRDRIEIRLGLADAD